METRSVEGKFDTLLSLKSKVSNLQGHNDELRSVLREVRYEATKARVELEKNTSKVSLCLVSPHFLTLSTRLLT